MAKFEAMQYAPNAIETEMRPTTAADIERGGFGPITLEFGGFTHIGGTKVTQLFLRRPSAIDLEIRLNLSEKEVPSATIAAVILSRLSGYPLHELRTMDAYDYEDCLSVVTGFFTAFLNRVEFDPNMLARDTSKEAPNTSAP